MHARWKGEGEGDMDELDRHNGAKEKAKLCRLLWNQFIAYFLLSCSVYFAPFVKRCASIQPPTMRDRIQQHWVRLECECWLN